MTSVEGCATVETLRARFIERARADCVSVLEFCQAVVNAPRAERRDPLDAAARLLHKLAGTAGTFGLTGFGAQARRLHTLATQLAAQPEAEFAARIISLSEGTRELARTLDAVVPGPSEEICRDHAHARPQVPSSAEVVLFASAGIATHARRALKGFGYGVREVASMTELADEVATGDIAAILIELDGGPEQLAGLKRVRAMQENAVPVLAISAYSDFEDYLAAARAGVDGYFVEPIDIPRLESRLNYLIEHRFRESIRVLAVDDDRELLEACAHMLGGEGMIVRATDNPADVIGALSEFRPDVVLMDIEMPGCTGPEMAHVIRLHEEWIHVPIVYMSAQSEGADQLLATRRAGEAFISKPLDRRELVATLCAHVRNARQMIETASRDTLTGALKTSFIHEFLDLELERGQRANTSTCVVMIDLDNFKAVNDQHGHPAGDVVIRTLASVIRQRLRLADGFGRVGGEEFLAVLSGCNPDEALEVMEDIRKRFCQIEFAGAAGTFHLGFSAGISSARPGEGSREVLVEIADRALYAAKAAGRNRIELG